LLFLAALIPLTACRDTSVVARQVTGPNETNAYLLYDVSTGKAALLDVAGPIDSLIAVIDREGLQVEYLFTTHGHPDHVQGLPEVRRRFPEARWGISREEFEDLSLYARFEEELPPDVVAGMRAAAEQDPAFAEMLAFDFARLGEPDLFLEEGGVHKLGDLEIHTFLTPGHSRGSISFHVGNSLFSGDVLFQGRVGRTDFPKSGGAEAMNASVRKLYDLLPGETIVYPGHGEVTDIGTEKLLGTGVQGDTVGSP
jgi:glyoxylase-like metal-dependent hydrolase (beta-lactamase superfamily II)